MSLLITLINTPAFIVFPRSWEGWFGLLIWIGVIGWLLYFWRNYRRAWNSAHWLVFVALLLLVPILSLFIGLKLTAAQNLPLPGMTLELGSLPLMLFSALPWVVAGGILGPFAAVIIAVFTGLLLGLWGTHNIFTALELGTMAILFSVASQQRYRTSWYKGLRHPFIAATAVGIIYPSLFVLSSIWSITGSVVDKLNYALVYVGTVSLATAIPILIAGLIAEFAKVGFPKAWGGQPPYRPSPAEISLGARFSYLLTPLLVGLLLVFMIGDWVIAGNAARQMLESRMASAADVVSTGMPYYLNTGQNLILELGNQLDPGNSLPEQMQEILESGQHSVPFFQQLIILDAQLELLAEYPSGAYENLISSFEEQIGLTKALEGVPVQVYAIPSLESRQAAQFSFLAGLSSEDSGTISAVLIGRADLIANPLGQPIVASLDSITDLGGVGLLVDESGNILYQSASERTLQEYPGGVLREASFYEETATDGTRQFVYFSPVVGRTWGTLMMVPSRQAQQLALNIAVPVLGMILFLMAVAAFLMRISLQMVTSSLRSLTVEAEHIAQGQFGQSIPIEGMDEAGRLRNSFEKMRQSLKARLDELNRLLLVSQGVASNLEIGEAIRPIIESALGMGAGSAHLVLVPDILPDSDTNGLFESRFAVGSDAETFRYFDDQLLALMKDQTRDRIVLTNPARTPLLNFEGNAPQIGSLMAVALRHERMYFGVLWVGYAQPHAFTDEEVQFMVTLGGQAALATANARLFMTAEFERERLAAILASTPDPVLVTDQQDRLLLINTAAWQMLGIGLDASLGKPVGNVIHQEELVDLMKLSNDRQEPTEVALHDGRVFMATASTIQVEGRKIGRVCVLKDVTQFKELDALKSEFVSTVSHDLRSPLTLMRGYATMLETVGELNKQQTDYVRKIVVGVENISRLVNNLLDLGRIEAGVGLQLEILPVRDIVEWVIDSFQLQAQQKKITLQANLSENLPSIIEADQALLQQALHNLVENAVKYTSDGGKIIVRVMPRREHLLFSVEDTGIGISPVDQPRLFEKFYRSADRDAKRESGTGLGLAIVKSIVERHGGQIGVESKLGEGSKFYFEIPIRQPKN